MFANGRVAIMMLVCDFRCFKKVIIHKFLIQNYKSTPKSSKFQQISQKYLKTD